jgi:hypothetical protein
MGDNNLTNGAKKGFDLDVRGLLAILSLVGAFLLSGLQLAVVVVAHTELKDVADIVQATTIPAWAAAITAGVAGFYFGSRAGGEATVVTTAAQAAAVSAPPWYTTAQHQEVLRELEALREELVISKKETAVSRKETAISREETAKALDPEKRPESEPSPDA